MVATSYHGRVLRESRAGRGPGLLACRARLLDKRRQSALSRRSPFTLRPCGLDALTPGMRDATPLRRKSPRTMRTISSACRSSYRGATCSHTRILADDATMKRVSTSRPDAGCVATCGDSGQRCRRHGAPDVPLLALRSTSRGMRLGRRASATSTRVGVCAHGVAAGSMFLASPNAAQFSAAGVAVPIGAARELCATSRRTVGAQHAERTLGQTTPGGLPVTVMAFHHARGGCKTNDLSRSVVCVCADAHGLTGFGGGSPARVTGKNRGRRLIPPNSSHAVALRRIPHSLQP